MRKGYRCVQLVPVALLAWLSVSAQARDIEWQLPAQPLHQALVEFSEAAKVQLWYPTRLAEGRSAPALQGSFDVEAALSQLLADSGLVFRRTAPDTFFIEQRHEPVRAIAPVRVEGVQRFAVRGANGSHDTLATEGSGRYVAQAATVGSLIPQVLHDTPRSISVLTTQQLSDRNTVELSDALAQVPGVAVRQVPSSAAIPVLRGLTLREMQYDGGATASLEDAELEGDLSAYDRIELLRGADGLGNGYISAAGVLNLVRKRPLDHAQVLVDLWGGSWHHYRGQLDVSAPLGWEGRVRARGVAAYVDRNYFYDRADMTRRSLYGIVEADLTPGTLLSLGFQDIEQEKTPWASLGMPRTLDGGAPSLPRSASFVVPWDYDNTSGRHWFANLDHALGEDWQLRLRLNRMRNEQARHLTRAQGLIDESTNCCVVLMPPEVSVRDRVQETANLRLNGRFMLAGHAQQIVFNLAQNRRNSVERFYESSMDMPWGVNILNFDPSEYPVPNVWGPLYTQPRSIIEQRSLSISMMLTFWEPLQITGAWRRAYYSSEVQSSTLWIHSLKFRDHYQGPSYLGLRYALAENWNLFANWADVYQSVAGLSHQNGSRMPPMKGSNYELGLKFASADGTRQASLALYDIRQKGFPVFDPGGMPNAPGEPACCFAVSHNARVVSRGVEAELAGEVLPGVQVSALYSYNDNDKQGVDLGLEEGIDTLYAPRHLVQFWSNWTPRRTGWNRLTVGAGLHLQSRTPWTLAYDQQGQPILTYQGTDPVFSGRLGWAFNQYWSGALTLNNVLDREYYVGREVVTSGNLYGDPSNLMLSLRGRF